MSGRHSRFGYSAVSTYEQCPYRYRLQYLDHVETLPDYAPDNALVVGTAFHMGMQYDAETALRWYRQQFPCCGDAHENEIIKLEALIPKVRAMLDPRAVHERFVRDGEFLGTIDYLEPTRRRGEWDMVDFKYCSASGVERYRDSPQIHLYRRAFERTTGQRIRRMGYLCVPKTKIRQKKTESLEQFRRRLRDTCAATEPIMLDVPYDPAKVEAFDRTVEEIKAAKEWPKKESRLCEWCPFYESCQKGNDYMITLPSTERRDVSKVTRRKMWIYGPSFSGKTTMLDKAPNPLNLNTDGNIGFVTMPYIAIKDEVTVEGRITRRKFAWQVFKDAIEELEKKQNGFDTIIVDLVEDTREMCRLYEYDRLGIQHESDSSFGKGWDIIKTEYLSTMRRFFALDYENLIIVSHESSGEVKKSNGQNVTRIMPNIQEAIANKLAGMVDIVARVVVEDDGTRRLDFKSSEYVFGGGRLKGLEATSIPLDWDELTKVYDVASGAPKRTARNSEEPTETERPIDGTSETSDASPEEAPAPRQRKRRVRGE